jgi:hypothetical protein
MVRLFHVSDFRQDFNGPENRIRWKVLRIKEWNAIEAAKNEIQPIDKEALSHDKNGPSFAIKCNL